MRGRHVLIAFGGNALVQRGEDATQNEQKRRAARLARILTRATESGARLALVHGNGPQVGDALMRVESSALWVPTLPLDVCVAESQGSIGFLLERALRNALRRASAKTEPVTVLTQVLVRNSDPQLKRPTKPIGPYYPRYRANQLKRQSGWRMIREEGRGFRRVVPSPHPVEILGLESIRALYRSGHIVIAGGGGGIPVARVDGALEGVEAVIDKDYTASLLARGLEADLFVILTDVDGAYENFGRENERLLSRLTVSRARRGLTRGEFPPGSMGPKVEASVEYVRATGRPVLITNAENLTDGLSGRAGTRVVPDPGDSPRRRKR